MNKKHAAISTLHQKVSRLQKKVEPSNGRWGILGVGLVCLGCMLTTESHGSILVGLAATFVASLSAVGFLAVNLQAVFVKPILEILQDLIEVENIEDANDHS